MTMAEGHCPFADYWNGFGSADTHNKYRGRQGRGCVTKRMLIAFEGLVLTSLAADGRKRLAGAVQNPNPSAGGPPCFLS